MRGLRRSGGNPALLGAVHGAMPPRHDPAQVARRRAALYIKFAEYVSPAASAGESRPGPHEAHAMDMTATTDRTAAPALPGIEAMAENARDAAALLKALSHEGRLMMLCALVAGERSVGELEGMLGARQAAVSQQLARLRLEGLVKCRRDGKQMLYSLGDGRVARIVEVLHDIYCGAPRPA